MLGGVVPQVGGVGGVMGCRNITDRGDVTEFGSLNHSPGKRVLNNLKTICLRFRKVVVQRVAVIKLRVNNRTIDVAMVLAVLQLR